MKVNPQTYRGQCKWMPLKVGHRGDIDEHVLASLSMETFLPHLEFNGLGRMLNYLWEGVSKTGVEEKRGLLGKVGEGC